jgi:hypothetical protein
LLLLLFLSYCCPYHYCKYSRLPNETLQSPLPRLLVADVSSTIPARTRFEVYTTELMKIQATWDVAAYR